jgi:2-oxoglutarate ferredoxin oxidoreductase subunit gamma
MLTRIILAGFGGQGILVAGKLLAYAAMREGLEVTHYPSYGAEMRGGTCNCAVVISDKPIASPVFSTPDIAVVMNKPSKLKYESKISNKGTIVINSTLVEEKACRSEVECFYLPASQIAEEIGSVKAANMAVLGALSKITGLIKLESLIDSLKEVFPNINEKLLEINVRALKKGFEVTK